LTDFALTLMVKKLAQLVNNVNFSAQWLEAL